MKRRRATTFVVVGALLAASAVCLGVRRSLDLRRSELAIAAGGAGAEREKRGEAETVSRPAKESTGVTRDPEAMTKRVRSLLSSGDPVARLRGFLPLLDTLDRGDFPGLLESMSQAGAVNSVEYSLALEEWVRVDPAAAMAWAGEGFARRSSVLTVWSRSDPKAALEWALHHGDRGGINQLYVTTLKGVAAVDLALATRLLREQSAGGLFEDALRQVSIEVTRGGREPARQWLDSMDSESFRIEAVRAIISSKGPFNVQEHLYWLEQYPEAARERQMRGCYATLLKSDQEAALTHFAGLPPGAIRQQAVEGMTAVIAELGNPDRGIAFMDRFPESVDDAVVAGWMTATSGSDPSLALSQASRFGDDHARDEACGAVLDGWFRNDPEAASSWLAGHEVSTELRERFDGR